MQIQRFKKNRKKELAFNTLALFPQPLTSHLVCPIASSLASSVIHKPRPPSSSPNSFLKQRNVHPQIQRKGRPGIYIRRYYTIHVVSPIYFRTVNLPISKNSFNVRTLLDYFNAIPESQAIQMKTLTDNIQVAWTKAEKRIFLKHSLKTRLVGLCVTSFH